MIVWSLLGALVGILIAIKGLEVKYECGCSCTTCRMLKDMYEEIK